jgi:MFS family permease
VTAPGSKRYYRVAFSYVFLVYLMAAIAETLISPLYPLIRQDLHLSVAQQASLTAVMTAAVALCNVLGGVLGHRYGDRVIIRMAAIALTLGSITSGTAHSYDVLLSGQVLIGIGSGLFWASGMATIRRMFAGRLGRIVAAYGLAYSGGLGLAAFAGDLGIGYWRWAFYATAAASLCLVVFSPRLQDAENGASAVNQLWTSLRRSLARTSYRMALVTAVIASTSHYIILGFAPLLFTERGGKLVIIVTFLGIGRFISAGGKYGAGWLVDKFGGRVSAVCIMLGVTIVGLPFLLLPPIWAAPVAIPLLFLTSGLFTVSNILSVLEQPSRSTFNLGVYRGFLVCFSSVASSAVTLLLRVTTLQLIMISMLALPVVASVVITVMGRTMDATSREPPNRPAQPQTTTSD